MTRSFLCGVALGLFALAPALPAFARNAAPAQTAPRPAIAPVAEPSNSDDEFDPAIARRLSVEDLRKRLDAQEKVIYLDNRYKPTGPIAKGAQLVMSDQIAEWAKNVPKDAFIVNYCTCHGETSSVRAVLELQKLGFTNAYALLGGLGAYQMAGLPTELPAQP
jgi:rhodanese-related sulfurtransferase